MTAFVAMALGLILVAVCATAVAALLWTGSLVDACVTWYVVAVVAVVGALLLVGVPGLLRPGPLLAVHAVEAAVPVVLLARRRGLLSRPGIGRRLLALAHGGRWESVLVLVAVLALGWQLVVALVLPPYAYDALSYHLTNVATWVQAGGLVPVPLDLCCGYYPGNADLVSAWSAVLLHSDALVGTVQVLAAAAGGVAVAGIGRTAGLSTSAATAAGALFVLTPAVLAQAPTPYVDVVQTALVLCALHGFVRFTASARTRHLLVPALCTAVLSGTKGNGLLWAVALGVTAVVLGLVAVRRGRVAGSAVLRALGGGALACLLLGGWWYARNAVVTGNPLYPFEVRVGQRVLAPGPFRVDEVLTVPPRGAGRPWPVAVALSWAADLLPWRHGSYDYQQRAGGLGPLWSWLGVSAVPVLIGLWRRRNPALVAVLPVLAVFVVQPYPWWARFTLPWAALGSLSVVAAVVWLRRPLLRRALQLAVLALALLGALLVVVEVNPASQAQPLPARRVLALVGAPASDRTLGRLFLPEYRSLDQVPATATVVVDVEAPDIRFVYPLYGRQLRRTVLPWSGGPVPDTAWVVSSPGRPLDAEVARSRSVPVSDVRGVRVWAPSR